MKEIEWSLAIVAVYYFKGTTKFQSPLLQQRKKVGGLKNCNVCLSVHIPSVPHVQISWHFL